MIFASQASHRTDSAARIKAHSWGSNMTKVLTSWKEIAQYLGKGVRTVQRWEADFALPVRRAQSSRHRAILAIPEELDYWLLTNAKTLANPPEERPNEAQLRAEVIRLRAENSALRRWLRLPEGDRTELPGPGPSHMQTMEASEPAGAQNTREAAA